MTKQVALNFFDSIKDVTKPEEFNYIYVTSFSESSAEAFYKEFLKLDASEEVKIIPIIINSYGGNVHALLSMLDIMKTSSKPIATIAIGKAMSCGAVLLSAGDKGYRFAGPSAEILIHEVSSMGWGKNADIQNDAKQTDKLNKKLMRLMASNCGMKDKNYFLKLSIAKGNIDLYFTAKQCKKMKLVDHDILPVLLKT